MVAAPSGMEKDAYSFGTPMDFSVTRWVTGMTPIEERDTNPRENTGHTRRAKPATGMPLNSAVSG